ncbi:MAG: site-2 protease family protein [Bacillota bacterium]
MPIDETLFSRLPALIIALVFHEFAHAAVADQLGDPTPRYAGRLTLNPLAHLDPIGFVALWFFRFGWAKPVPVNPYNFRDYRRGMLTVALAGPVMNVILAFITLLVIKIFTLTRFSVIGNLVWYLLYYNVWIAVFNLIPVPPLDGSKVLAGLLPGRQTAVLYGMQPYSWLVLFALIYLGIIPMILLPVSQAVLTVLDRLTSLILYAF